MPANPKPRSAQSQPTTPSLRNSSSASAKEMAQRHYQRAQEHVKLRQSNVAVQELRDAIQLDPTTSDYHALLGKVQLDKGLTKMATISLREALKLNPQDAIALDCMKQLKQPTPAPEKNAAPGLVNRVLGFLTQKL